MLRIMLIDDEALIIQGLKKMIDWEKLGMEVIGEANDGEQALQLIHQYKPDIVVMDIKMPVKSGLEVIQEMYEEAAKPQFILLSGFQEFAFAQEAIKYGAIDYLLKPVTKKDLEQSLVKAAAVCKNQSTIDLFREETDEVVQLFQSINDGQKYAEHELYERFSESGIEFEGKFFVGISIGIVPEQNERPDLSFEMNKLKRFSVYNRIADECKEKKNGFVIRKEDDYIHLIGVFAVEDKDNFIEKYLKPLKEKIEEEMDTRLVLGIGYRTDHLASLKSCYKTSKFAYELYYFEEQEIIDFETIHKDYTVSFEDFNTYKEEVLRAIVAKNEHVIEQIERVMQSIRDIHYGNRYAAGNRTLLFTGELAEKLYGYHMLEGDFQSRQDMVQELIRTKRTYREMTESLLEFYRQLLPEIYQVAKSKDSSEILRVKEYILAHYMDDLSIRELAEVACVSQNYFSAMFKKETGQNYKAYLTKIRMEQALALVLDSDLKTYEIAEEVGYNNVRRFVEAFKQTYKMSPMDYRKVYAK